MITICCLLLLFPQTAERLRDVRAVYVGEMGNSDESKFIREKLITALEKSKRLVVVDDESRANAVLTGVSNTREGFYANNGTGRSYHITEMIVKLKAGDHVLWSIEAKTGRWRWSDEAHEKVVKELLKAIEKDEKKK